MQFKNFTLDQFQDDAVKAIEENCSVVVSAPTGSGKTLIADYIIDKFKDKTLRIMYTAPIKALSNQKYRDFCKSFERKFCSSRGRKALPRSVYSVLSHHAPDNNCRRAGLDGCGRRIRCNLY